MTQLCGEYEVFRPKKVVGIFHSTPPFEVITIVWIPMKLMTELTNWRPIAEQLGGTHLLATGLTASLSESNYWLPTGEK